MSLFLTFVWVLLSTLIQSNASKMKFEEKIQVTRQQIMRFLFTTRGTNVTFLTQIYVECKTKCLHCLLRLTVCYVGRIAKIFNLKQQRKS